MEGDWQGDGAVEAALDRSAASSPAPSRTGRLLRGLVLIVLLGAVATAGTLYWLHERHFESTDDAFIDANQSQIAAQISGKVVELLVDDNQHVEAGQALLTIDPRDYQVKLEQVRAAQANAAAQASEARAQLVLQQAQLAQNDAQVRVAEADLDQASRDLARYRAIDPAAITRQQLDQSTATTKSATAKLDSARQAVLGGKAQLDAQQAKIAASDAAVRQADADIHNAELQLSYTRIVAPFDGVVGERQVQPNDYVNIGTNLINVVPLPNVYVIANYKETQDRKSVV